MGFLSLCIYIYSLLLLMVRRLCIMFDLFCEELRRYFNMKREAGGQDFRVNFRVNFRSAWRPAGMSRHNQQRSLLKKAARSWEAPMR